MKNFKESWGKGGSALLAFLTALLFASSALAQENPVLMQYFHWYYPNDGSLWTKVQYEASNLADVGITALWLPPAYKADKGASDNGYGVYDLYDLGEFNQRGSIATKYGTKQEYLNAISSAHSVGVQVYGDIVFNHKGGADGTEWVEAIRIDSKNRTYAYGSNTWIQAWTKFDFPARANAYSSFKWRAEHFDGVDWDQNTSENSIFRFIGKNWDWEVDTEFANFDYLMYADLDFNHTDVVNELKNWGEWYVNTTDVDGFRLDAIKHIKYDFFPDWLTEMRSRTGKELFTVGEFWSYKMDDLRNYISKTGGVISVFDAPLHINFFNASNSGGGYDMRYLLDNTVLQEFPGLAVTVVDNHDTQACQPLSSPVMDWFKPLAYAVTLLREDGYPTIFYADYYGASYNDCGPVTQVSHKTILDKLLAARRDHAYGTQTNYFDHHDMIGWTRAGDAAHPESMAVLITDGPGGSKWMSTGKPNTTYADITGNVGGTITTDGNGWGNFSVDGGSVSVWVGGATPLQNESVCFTCYNGTTYMGQNVYVVGSIPELGNWNPDQALKLDPANYPTWVECFDLPAGTSFEWKCIKKDGSNVVWQSGANNSYSGGGSTSGSF